MIESGDKINYGKGKKISHFGIFSEGILKTNGSGKYVRNYKRICLLVKKNKVEKIGIDANLLIQREQILLKNLMKKRG